MIAILAWDWDSTEPIPCACDGLMFRGTEALIHTFAYWLVLVGVAAAAFLAISQMVTRRRAREGPDTHSPEDEEPSQDGFLDLPARTRVLFALISVVSVTGGIVLRLLS